MNPQLQGFQYPHNFIFYLVGGFLVFIAIIILLWRNILQRHDEKRMREIEEGLQDDLQKEANADKGPTDPPPSRESSRFLYAQLPIQSTYGGLGPPPGPPPYPYEEIKASRGDGTSDIAEAKPLYVPLDDDNEEEDEDGFELQPMEPPRTAHSTLTVSSAQSSDLHSISNWSTTTDLGPRVRGGADRLSILSETSTRASSAGTLIAGRLSGVYQHHRRASSYRERQELVPPNETFRSSTRNSTLYVSPASRMVVRGARRNQNASVSSSRRSSAYAHMGV